MVIVRSFGRLLDLLRPSAWPRDPALVVGGQLQQPPLDQRVSLLGKGPDCPCPFPAKLVVHIRPRNSSTMGESVGQVV